MTDAQAHPHLPHGSTSSSHQQPTAMPCTPLADDGAAMTPTTSSAGPSTQLPLSNISRLMKSSLPSSSLKLSSPTKTLMQDIVSEFILFITCEAQERADAQRRSTLNGDDILYALEVLGFEEYERVGKVWLSRYRIAQEALAHKSRKN